MITLVTRLKLICLFDRVHDRFMNQREMKMSVRLQIAALIYMIVQAVTFGIGAIVVLASPLDDFAMYLMPVAIVVSALVSLPISWVLAPRLRSRFGNSRNKLVHT